MLFTYRRTGRPLAILAFVAIALVTILTAAVAAAVLIVGLIVAVAISVARAVMPRSWRQRALALTPPGPYDILEGTVVDGGHRTDEE